MKFSIVIPTYSNTKGVSDCLKSLVEFTDLSETEIIVVANGAPQETKDVLELYRYFPVKLIWLPEACGYTHATNVGIEAAAGEFVVLLNDDCILLPQSKSHWLNMLVEPFVDGAMAITGPVLHRCPDADREFLIFFCVMIRREAIEEVGVLDEIFSPGYGEDTDWCCRAVDKGWKMQQVPPSRPVLVDKGCEDLPQWKRDKMWSNPFPLYHDGNQTFGKDPEYYDQVLRRNAKVLKERYGMTGINLERARKIDGWFAPQEMMWVAQQAKHCKVIIEIGSWHGRSSRAIADNLPEGGVLYCVDTWNGSSGEPDAHATARLREGDHAHSWWMRNLFDLVQAGKVVPVRMSSPNAAETLRALGVQADMIFVDADHSYEGVKTDILAWRHLLKADGLFCGHDYYTPEQEPFTWMGVRTCINEMFPDVQQVPHTSIWWSRSAPVTQPDRLVCIVVGDDLNELEEQFKEHDWADRFIVVEGRETFEGQPKPLHFSWSIQNESRFAPWLDRVTHLQSFDFKGDAENPHVRERWMWDSVMSGLNECKNEDEITLVGEWERTVRYAELKASSPSAILFDVLPVEPVERGHVYDCFMFHNELDVLEIRLATLNDVVDRFVLVEGTLTHSGKPKPLYFDLNKERFAPYLNKITHIIVDDWPAEVEGATIYDNAWAKERWQRDRIAGGLRDCHDNDIIICGDADEIASPEAIRNYDVSQGLCRLKQRLFYYYLNCENPDGWDWLKIAPYSIVRELSPCGIRYPPAGNTPLILKGGWHFSFCGDAEHIATKIRDYSHQEYNIPEINNREHIEAAMAEGKDVFNRGFSYITADIEGDDWPEFIKNNRIMLAEKGLIKGVISGHPWPQILDSEPVSASPRQELSLTSEPIDLAPKNIKWEVTACVSTKDRYTTTLPMCLAAIINQTHRPDKLIVYDDSEQRIPAERLCQQSPFEGLFKLATDKGIAWVVLATPREGQVANHQHCLDNATTPFIWRVDDDEVPEPECLQRLLSAMLAHGRGGDFNRIGAIAGLVHHPGAVSPLPAGIDGSLGDVMKGLNLQWFNWNSGPREVQHLYSTFLYNVAIAKEVGGYPRNLSKVGHREETIFTHQMARAGYKLVVTPDTRTYHLREATGGIRSFTDTAMWERDEQVFQGHLQAWGITPTDSKLVVLDMGLGDHLIFKGVLTELRRKHPERRWTLAVCFPEVFKDSENVTMISIADAKMLVGNRYDDYSLYKWMWDRNYSGSIVDAMTEFWG